MRKIKNPFESFWMAGYECTDKLNAFGKRVDFLHLTGHFNMLEADYEALNIFSIKTVREGIRWSQVEKRPYEYDWSTVGYMIATAKAKNIQQVWDLCHFGFPDDLSPLHPLFAKRFAALCRAFVRFYRSVDADTTLIVTPVNEVSFLSWLGGDACGTSPYTKNYGWEVKYAIMKAYIEGVEALLHEDANIRILTTEPLVNMVAPVNASPQQIQYALNLHENQFQVLEMLSGRICPELRGKPEYLDILGFNFYHNNQWITSTFEFLPWLNENEDPRWQSLSSLLANAYDRYKRPMVLSETSHPMDDRPHWIEFISKECANILHQDIPLWGVCWYPIIDRPDWDHMHPWHRAGVWDVVLTEDNIPVRNLHQPTANALLEAQRVIGIIQSNEVAAVI